jgi:hypothetical protein
MIFVLVVYEKNKRSSETTRPHEGNLGTEIDKEYLSNGFKEVKVPNKEPAKYSDNYEKKARIMTLRERLFYDKLKQVVVAGYYIYPQVHVTEILQPKQSLYGGLRLAAFRGISQKSVDYLIVDNNQSPVLAIELDDSTHEKEDRADRDWFIECAFKSAGVPLLRFASRTDYNVSDLEFIRRFLRK